MSEGFDQTLNSASNAINAGNFQEALTFAREACAMDPSNADAKLMEAIALSQVGQPNDASVSFDTAIRLNPASSKIRFNAAIHAFNGGNFDYARELAQSALSIEPDHAGTLDLIAKLPAPAQTIAPPAGAPFGTANYPRSEGFTGNEPPAGLPFITKLGPTWTTIGWVLTFVGAAFFVFSLMKMLPMFGEMMSAAQSGDQAKTQAVQNKYASPGMSAVGYALSGATLIYTILDLIHRRGNMLWLIGHIPCSCCGLGWITLPIYLLTGRK